MSFINKVGKFKYIYAFEPDEENFKTLNKELEELSVNACNDQIIAFNAGVFDKNERVLFQPNSNGGGSQINENGLQTIEVLALDSVLCEKEVTFIKMDIEGAEKEALLGAKEIITSQRPKLAICVYHKPEDLWEIPLLIKSWVPEYKLYLRHHCHDITETVCYAVLD
ncbi:hypothetical protein DEAC_c44790 [Desulfosporosinus acididurans]|uniref:Methyltransferase FkbM domain-containing protein n=1 Tax=Desulfosporosinus acididurans TaxID=476652 RepID=A0A0J1FJL9_9FIRM|nr:hypothetical protein DEAC_c44790 [Desulfosporosinus acididurans]